MLSLSDLPSKRMKYTVDSWAKTLPKGNPMSRRPGANSVKSGRASSAGNRNSSNGTGSAPALTSSRSQAASSASILTGGITISNKQAPETVKIKEGVYWYEGGLSDNDETVGVERDAALASAFKGKKRLTSEVYSL
jgi:hypothetical protein